MGLGETIARTAAARRPARRARTCASRSRPLPQLAPGMVRVRFGAGGICGSDLHYFQHGDRRFRRRAPLVLGHEVAGEIVEMRAAAGRLRKVGHRVAVNPCRFRGCDVHAAGRAYFSAQAFAWQAPDADLRGRASPSIATLTRPVLPRSAVSIVPLEPRSRAADRRADDLEGRVPRCIRATRWGRSDHVSARPRPVGAEPIRSPILLACRAARRRLAISLARAHIADPRADLRPLVGLPRRRLRALHASTPHALQLRSNRRSASPHSWRPDPAALAIGPFYRAPIGGTRRAGRHLSRASPCRSLATMIAIDVARRESLVPLRRRVRPPEPALIRQLKHVMIGCPAQPPSCSRRMRPSPSP